MYKFITTRCCSCGAVICNLPELEAKKLKNVKLQCEDCSHHDFFNSSGSVKVSSTSSKYIKISA